MVLMDNRTHVTNNPRLTLIFATLAVMWRIL